jgi:hypothetical protein
MEGLLGKGGDAQTSCPKYFLERQVQGSGIMPNRELQKMRKATCSGQQ